MIESIEFGPLFKFSSGALLKSPLERIPVANVIGFNIFRRSQHQGNRAVQFKADINPSHGWDVEALKGVFKGKGLFPHGVYSLNQHTALRANDELFQFPVGVAASCRVWGHVAKEKKSPGHERNMRAIFGDNEQSLIIAGNTLEGQDAGTNRFGHVMSYFGLFGDW
jgi:hypothetical protein